IPWGLSGMLFARFWLETILHLPLAALDPVVRATFVSEFRFLEARELGVGLLALAFRERIVSERLANHVFLAAVAAAPVSRAIAWLTEGPPHLVFQVFATTEVLMTIVIFWTTRRTLASARS
ncbi:MAG: hypothetical protein JWM74_611, partial [Myxococcaceae bacterium]|nr:hypothetical protein [Myxococcaceae bacterium]